MSKIAIVMKRNGKELRFVETIFLINTKYPDGSPRNCTLLPDDHTIELAGGEEFLRAFVNEEMLSKSGTGDL